MPQDDSPLYKVVRDLSGGQNSRQGENIIGENQATVLQNVELNTAGERAIRSGVTRIDDTFPATAASADCGMGLFGFEPDGGTNSLLVMVTPSAGSSASLWKYTGSGVLTSATNASGWSIARTTMIKALESDQADVVIIQNGTDAAFRMAQDYSLESLGNTNTSPPKTRAMTYYRDRVWGLSGNSLAYSEAISSAYASAFVRDANYYDIPVGTERAVVGTRDYGLIAFGSEKIYQVNPSIIPDPAKDKSEIILDMGCANGDTVKQVGDDFFYLAYDGVRALRRTVQDKLQAGQSQPLSWNLKPEFEEINWAYIAKADAIYFEDKYLVTLPTGDSSTNNKIWVYYPSLQSWVVITGLNISRFATVKFSNQMRLYGVDAINGRLYRMFYGTSDNATAINYQEEGRAEDFGKPLQNKWGGEFKMRVRGNSAVLTPTADIGNGYTPLDGDSIVIPAGGLSFNFYLPISFADQEADGIWHLDSLGKFKTIKFKIYCNTLNANFRIMESLATTFGDEYQSED